MASNDDTFRVNADAGDLLFDAEAQEGTLLAALAFVDEFECDPLSNALVGVDDDLEFLSSLDLDSVTSTDETASYSIATPSTSTNESPAPAKPAQPRRTRTNRREELIYLRSTVEEMETKLTELKEQAKEKDERTPDLSDVMKAVWEDLANRQYQQRQQAEAENTRLRMMLEDQIKIAKSLERLLRKRNDVELFSSALSKKRSRAQLGQSPLREDSIVDELMGSLLQMHPHVDRVLEDPRFHVDAPKPLRDIQLRTAVGFAPTIEIVESRIVPFNFMVTANAMWELLATNMQDSITEHIHTATEDTLIKSFEGVVQTHRTKGVFQGKVVARRFVEADRVVMLGGHVAEPVEFSDRPIRGVIMRHRGWTVIRRGPNDTTLLQTYHLAAPDVYDASQDQQRTVGALTNFVLATVEMNLDAGLLQIENYLLETQKHHDQDSRTMLADN
ncbi:hypothetical protein Poli38472_004868 [Pythium oligandrum]|uniref:Uncharacterized protein n=1 Tax=Pythium oligandrum TaxID=41045 RepID=A0A8K1CAL0_PYTOL|nr:hypothetical protein Poli38472_004868 [Pythium oligandrum]|eukprot:TMW59799.1 hypothetical protein Poli38472_004868 [Pythium oligandrum]